MTRKPRSDAKLLNLPEEDQRTIFDLLRHGVSYAKAKPAIKKKFGLATSDAALSAFWEFWSRKDSEERIFRNARAATETVEAISESLPLLNQATTAALQQATFEAIYSGADPKMIKDFSNILLKSRALDQADQTLALRLREFEQKIADAQGALDKARKDGGMTPEAIERMEQALGLL